MWSSAGCSTALSSADEEALSELTEQLSNFNWKEGVVDRAKRLLYSSDINDNIKGAMNLKAMLCIGRDEVYEVAQEVIDAGVVIRLVDFLKINNRDIQYPAAFCLTNVAAGHDEQTQTVVDAGAIDPLIGFLTCSSAQLRRQAVFCLANIGGSTPQYRILLARHPEFFSSMFLSAEMAQEAKILELICWNLRNVCLLGGPTFSDIKPGVEFLLNNILKRYWNYQQWLSCVRFASETVCATCRQEEGRAFLLQQNATESILNIIGQTHSLTATSHSVFEALAWILAFGRDCDKEAFVRDAEVIDVFIERALPGHLGNVIQELAFKCLAVIASEPEKLMFTFRAHNELFDICGRVFLGYPSMTVRNISAPSLTPTAATSSRECAGFVFAHCCLLSHHIPALLVRTLVGNDVVTVLLEVVEAGAEQIRQKQLSIAIAVDQQIESMNGGQTTTAVTGPGDGPPMTTISESLTVIALKALVELIRQGVEVQRNEDLPVNPLLRMCLESDAIGRLRRVLDTTDLPPDGFEIGNTLLQGLIIASS